MVSTLYEIAKEFSVFKDQLEGMELDEQTFQDTMEAIQLPLESKIENTIKYMKSLEALANAKKMEAKRLSESATSDLKRVEWLQSYMESNLREANITKLQAGIFNVGWRKGLEVVKIDETKTPSVDEAPHLYLYQEPKFISKTDLKKLVKDGQTIPGVSIVRNPDSLVIK
jgi:hypothetical protein